MSNRKKIYWSCLCLYALGTLLRIGLDRYWHSVNPRVIDTVTGHTYALNGRGGAVFVKPIEGYLLDTLYIVPWLVLLVGMLIWASAWRDWK